MPDLPPGWKTGVSKSTGKTFYVNPDTMESQWEPPGPEEWNKPTKQQERVQAAHILTKHAKSRRPSSWREENITRSAEEAFDIVRGYHKQITEGKASFEELAKTNSDCSSAAKGGDLGMFGRGQMQKAFEDVAFGLQVGEMSEPFASDSGIHIVKRLA